MRKITFRYASKEDSGFFANAMLSENDTRIKLAQFGWSDSDFDCDAWKATLVVEVTFPRYENRVPRYDNCEKERAGYVSVKGGDASGFNYIGGFYVLPEFRRQGIGQELLKRAEEYVFENWNAVGVDLFTIENEAMDQLVQKAGFSSEGVDKHRYYSNGRFYCQKHWIKLYVNNFTEKGVA